MGSINNSFRFGTVDSADYNLLVAGDGTFNAPERDVDTIEIPGRNGDLLIDKGRFKNITVEYTVYCYADDLDTFRTQLRNFRNALSSQKGYQKLTDTFHPDEYRLGTFISGFEAEPVMFNTVAEVVLEFDCKPQRFLLSGDEPIVLGEWGETETYSGSIVSFDGTETTAIKSLKVNITPKQSGTGDPSPSNVRPISGYSEVVTSRVGKNLLKIYYVDGGGSSIVTLNDDQTSITLNGTLSSASTINIAAHPRGLNVSDVPEGVQLVMSNSANIRLLLGKKSGGQSRWISPNSPFTIASTELASYFYYNIPAGTYNNEVITFQIELGSTATAYEPYNGTTYNTSLGQTVYGGTLEVVSGKLTIEWKTVDLGILTWAYDSSYQFFYTSSLNNDIINVIDTTEHPILSDKFKISAKNVSLSDSGYADMSNYEIAYHKRSMQTASYLYVKDTSTTNPATFKSSVSGSMLVYKLATPIEVTLTPTEVKTLLGQNNIWADAGTVEVEIGENPNVLVNPTLFESCPVFEVEGSGTLTVNNSSMTIANNGTTIIDSEMMEAYEEENGAIISRNDMVSGEFPTLKEGNNNIGADGLTSVKITPKWWEV